MKILIGCEESGRVREAFRGVGHDAWSCDLLPCTENPSKYHIQDDLLKVIKSEKWDMIIAFPPCTHLAISGAKYFPEKIADGRQQAAQALWLLGREALQARACCPLPVFGQASTLPYSPCRCFRRNEAGHNCHAPTRSGLSQTGSSGT